MSNELNNIEGMSGFIGPLRKVYTWTKVQQLDKRAMTGENFLRYNGGLKEEFCQYTETWCINTMDAPEIIAAGSTYGWEDNVERNVFPKTIWRKWI